MKSVNQILQLTDEQGRLRMSGLHDAQLAEFSYSSRKLLKFSLIGQKKEVTYLSISNPSMINVFSLWEGSIIDAVHAWNLRNIPEQTWSDPENAWNALLDQRVDPSDRRKEADRLIARQPESILIVVSCTYGGRWAGIGEEVSVFQTAATKA